VVLHADLNFMVDGPRRDPDGLPGSLYLMALSRRFTTACSRSTGSTIAESPLSSELDLDPLHQPAPADLHGVLEMSRRRVFSRLMSPRSLVFDA
jgi:hypothetical protein